MLDCRDGRLENSEMMLVLPTMFVCGSGGVYSNVIMVRRKRRRMIMRRRRNYDDDDGDGNNN